MFTVFSLRVIFTFQTFNFKFSFFQVCNQVKNDICEDFFLAFQIRSQFRVF